MLTSIGWLAVLPSTTSLDRALWFGGKGIASARSHLTEEEFRKAWQEGQAMSMEQAIEDALGHRPNG